MKAEKNCIHKIVYSYGWFIGAIFDEGTYLPSQGFELGIELGFELGFELGIELGFELGIRARILVRLI